MILNVGIFLILEMRDTRKNDLLIAATCCTEAEKLIYNSAIKGQAITTIFIAFYPPTNLLCNYPA